MDYFPTLQHDNGVLQTMSLPPGDEDWCVDVVS